MKLKNWTLWFYCIYTKSCSFLVWSFDALLLPLQVVIYLSNDDNLSLWMEIFASLFHFYNILNVKSCWSSSPSFVCLFYLFSHFHCGLHDFFYLILHRLCRYNFIIILLNLKIFTLFFHRYGYTSSVMMSCLI